ncbi:hypothetical protein P153DRAFT_385434 [Dothidotthia symphoricarpi CBS 119687]|uniref:Uncharacterized protein n=1 Tax=Dothidotthia symphoricarpi CBS 119687 TaxID=1392245 RepID=A0A6A6ADM4_9PLEO|nr:uncharacterized protein P153DRAFT_385434 [Dothidotthia symphoricarpi CBS 119687]KAF2129215.1 hypothetical protein P153DRAFT_385434 [Dothidotthia symphoricarpi CBS 119687]
MAVPQNQRGESHHMPSRSFQPHLPVRTATMTTKTTSFPKRKPEIETNMPVPVPSSTTAQSTSTSATTTQAQTQDGQHVERVNAHEKTEAEREADRLYEERMEDEYAKREGGA